MQQQQHRLLQRSRRGPTPLPPVRPHAPRGWLRRNGATVALFAITIIWVGNVASGLLSQQARLSKIEAEATRAGTHLGTVLEQNRALKQEIEQLKTDEYVELVARRQLGLIKPGEIPFTPVSP